MVWGRSARSGDSTSVDSSLRHQWHRHDQHVSNSKTMKKHSQKKAQGFAYLVPLCGYFMPLLQTEFRGFSGQHFIFGCADVSADPILIDFVDHDFITKLIASYEELYGFV